MHRIFGFFWFAMFFCAGNFVLIPQPLVAMPKSVTAAEGSVVTGTVVETMNSSGYTYLLVATGNTETWVAIPETTVVKGSVVHYQEGMNMPNFHSKSLNKTFENIIFSPGLAASGAVPAAAAVTAPVPASSPAAAPAKDDSFASALQAERKSGAAAPPPSQVSGGSAVAVAPLQEISIPKAEGDNAYTVEEIFTRNKELAGKTVRLRGKVVKVSPGIMGKNWVHLQDGTGNPLHNSHDLVFTTDATLEVDSVVIMEGILAADKDFGAGYTYTAIVEQATVSK